jgi:hypothetical protein
MPNQMASENYRPLPLDFLIVEQLPDKGIIGGVHWAGRSVRAVRDTINGALPEGAQKIESSFVQSRIRNLKVMGYVTDFPSHGSGRIWARTPEGAAFLATRDEVLRG